jgi:Holliday junction resolvase RusA-like endonuclease
MSEIRIVVPGNPVGKGRPRAFQTRGARRTIKMHTPEKTRAYEDAVALAGKLAMQGREPLGGPVAMRLDIFMPIPASWSKAKREAALLGGVMPISVPDSSNVLKAVEDALNGIAYIDDSQIIDVWVRKRYSHDPRIELEIVSTLTPDSGPAYSSIT